MRLNWVVCQLSSRWSIKTILTTSKLLYWKTCSWRRRKLERRWKRLFNKTKSICFSITIFLIADSSFLETRTTVPLAQETSQVAWAAYSFMLQISIWLLRTLPSIHHFGIILLHDLCEFIQKTNETRSNAREIQQKIDQRKLNSSHKFLIWRAHRNLRVNLHS